MVYAGDGLYWVGRTIFSSFSFHTSSLCWPLLALQYLRWTGSPTLKLCINSGVANATPGKVSPKCIGSQEANTALWCVQASLSVFLELTQHWILLATRMWLWMPYNPCTSLSQSVSELYGVGSTEVDVPTALRFRTFRPQGSQALRSLTWCSEWVALLWPVTAWLPCLLHFQACQCLALSSPLLTAASHLGAVRMTFDFSLP